MKHPIKKRHDNQAEFLIKCPSELKEFHAQLFRLGNATYRYHRYHQIASQLEPTEDYFLEWLEALPENIRKDMKEKGFEQCKTMLPFTR